MPNTAILSESQYSKLIKDIRHLIEEGKRRSAQAARQELVVTYWEVGKRISEEGLTEKAGYGESVLADLSDELNIDLSTLKRSLYFFHTYNHAPRGTNLTWSHYRTLLPIHNDDERKWYENLAARNALTAPQLGKAIKENRYAASQKHQQAPSKRLKRPNTPAYVYKAIVERVIDGDTLLLRLDLGFQVFKEQRVRLAEIDAPAMDQPGGRKAYKYVLDQLAKAAFVMVKTNKIDVYGRYVGHVFYSLKEKDKDAIFTKGRYLNQELVDRGLVQIL